MDFHRMKDQVWQEVKAAMSASNQTDSFWQNVQAFAHAVDWREEWIVGLLAAHVVTFLLVLRLRRNTTFLSLAFLFWGSAIYFGERINKLASQHWQQFATQDYFDSHGIFYSVMVSGPAVINLFTVLVLYLLEVTDLMVVVKKKEIIQKAKARARAEAAAGGKKQQ